MTGGQPGATRDGLLARVPEDRWQPIEVTIPAQDGLAYTIVCDESGATGENVRDRQRIMTHASLDLSPEYATRLMAELRKMTGSPAHEFKAKHLLRPSNEKALTWLLSPRGPIAGHAKVVVLDKHYFLVAKIVDVLVDEVQYQRGVLYTHQGLARRDTRLLFQQGRRALGGDGWNELLEGFYRMVRVSWRRAEPKTTVDEFFQIVDRLRFACHRRNVAGLLDLVALAKDHAHWLAGHEDPFPTLEPLHAVVPASVRLWWEQVHKPIYVIHDRVDALTDERLLKMQGIMLNPHPYYRGMVSPVDFAGAELVDSTDDVRVQVADLVAGAVREMALRSLTSDLPQTLGHLVGAYNLWGDEEAWLRLVGRKWSE